MEFRKLDERKTCVGMFVHVKSINSRGCTDGTISSKRCAQYSASKMTETFNTRRLVIIATLLLIVVTQTSQARRHHKIPQRRDRYYDYSKKEFNIDYNFDESSKIGPKYWYKKYPHCAGNKQSPIDIVTKDVQCDDSLTDFTYEGYDTIQTSPFLLFEFHDAWQIAMFEYEGSGISIRGPWLTSKFSLHSIYFWAGPGSMHKIDGKEFSLQIGMLHRNSEKYASPVEAGLNPDGIIDMAIFVQADDELSKGPDHQAFGNAFENVIAAAQMNTTCLLMFPVSTLLPSDRVYYKYHGSYYGPPCHESITWVVFQQPLYITQEQLERFRKIFSDSGKPPKNNGRPIQPLNGRIVSKLC